jgi:hypothetical protein
MMAFHVFIEHLENSNKTIDQEIFIRLRNCAWQSMDLHVKPRDDFTDGAFLPRLWQAPHTDLIQHFLQVHTKLVKPLAVTNVIISKKNLLRRNFSLTISHDLSLFLLKRVENNTKPCAFLF